MASSSRNKDQKRDTVSLHKIKYPQSWKDDRTRTEVFLTNFEVFAWSRDEKFRMFKTSETKKFLADKLRMEKSDSNISFLCILLMIVKAELKLKNIIISRHFSF